MAARVTEVRDAVAARVAAEWAPRAPDAVVAKTRVDVDSATHAGRKVYVFRSEYAGRPATREEDENDYTLAVMVVERYAPQGEPPESWVDERVAWCEWLLDVLGNPRRGRLLADPADPDSGLWPQEAAVTTVHDLEELAERKLFVSVLTLTYREQSPPRPIPIPEA